MKVIAGTVTSVVRFLLAAFLWLHALFFLNFRSSFFEKSARFLHLTTSEVMLLGLLVLFSLLAGSNIWKMLASLAYIYFFPFVLLFYLCVFAVRIAGSLVRWLTRSPRKREIEINVKPAAGVQPAPADRVNNSGFRRIAAKALDICARPFKRFTILWCLLVLFASHIVIIWLALIVVLAHLVRIALKAIRLIYFTKPWLSKAATYLRTTLDDNLGKLARVTRGSPKTLELQNLWNTLHSYQACAQFVLNSEAASKWASLLFGVFLGAVYLYLAFVFSFAYYGIARIYGLHYPWPEALTTSLFIPFYVADLPKMLSLRALGGLQCLLVVSIGVGSLLKYIRRHFEPLREVAFLVNSRLSDQDLHEKYCILEEVMGTPGTTTTTTSTQTNSH